MIKIKHKIESEQIQCAFAVAIAKVTKQITAQPTLKDILNLTPAIPHVIEVAINLTTYLIDDDLITPFESLGIFYECQGIYQQAETWFKQCREVAEGPFGN